MNVRVRQSGSTAAVRMAVALSLLLAAMSGCEPRSGPTSAPLLTADGSNGMPSPGDDDGEIRWPFWPTSMRVHPLTRLTTDSETGKPIIECRMEFSDSDGQTTKAVGQLTLQVYPDGVVPTGLAAMETWNQDLRDLAVNRRQYDDVTRTYLFRLHTRQPLPAGCEIRAYFLSSDGTRLNASAPLRP